MNNEYISRQEAVDVIEKEMKNYASDIWYKSATHSALNDVNENIKSIEHADVVPYSFAPDGTLTITVPKGTYKKINRVLVEEDGTHWGGLYYAD